MLTKANINSRRALLWLAEGRRCHWCGRETRLCFEQVADQATIDHVIPRYKNGTNDVSNLVSACRGCNARRNSEDMKNLPEGALMQGKAKSTNHHVCLTADDKKALLARVQATPPGHIKDKHKTEDVLREQRDQAMRELNLVRNELKLFTKIVEDQEKELKDLKSITAWKLIRKKVAGWLAH